MQGCLDAIELLRQPLLLLGHRELDSAVPYVNQKNEPKREAPGKLLDSVTLETEQVERR